jgi:serine protease inhibitor
VKKHGLMRPVCEVMAMARISRLLLIGCISMFVFACERSLPPGDTDTGGPSVGPGGAILTETELADAVNRFGFNLFKEVVLEQSDQNIFISPLSVSMALGMTQNGAAGTTLDAMMSTLELSGYDLESANLCYRNLIDMLTALDPEVRFQIANSIWYRSGLTPKRLFVQDCRTYFDAETAGLDFDQPEAADIMNQWVEDATNGLIKDMVQKPIPIDVVIILLNAIYFKGSWIHPFDADYTSDWWFTVPDGSKSLCRMMIQQESRYYTTFEGPDFYGVDMAYGDSLFSMTVLLPKAASHVDTIVAHLDQENWKTWTAGFRPWYGMLFMPKFELEYEVNLIPALANLGMGIAFFGPSDFSNMFTDGLGIFLSKVKHKTYIRVDEEGTEAAAVTEVDGATGIPPQFYVDKPFVFFIRENRSNTVLFMGKIVNPGYFE